LAPLQSRVQTTAAGRRSLHVRLDDVLLRGIRAFAAEGGLGLSSAVRLLTARALRETQPGSNPAVSGDETSVTLAALVAAEHAVLMVASVLPEGRRRMYELAPEAALAAEARLTHFRELGL
jgi:hypothetical protein